MLLRMYTKDRCVLTILKKNEIFENTIVVAIVI